MAEPEYGITVMKKTSSLKSLKKRDKNNKIVRRRDGKGKMRFYVINKENPRMKAKQESFFSASRLKLWGRVGKAGCSQSCSDDCTATCRLNMDTRPDL